VSIVTNRLALRGEGREAERGGRGKISKKKVKGIVLYCGCLI
jgi:hypothetical protein